MHSVRSSQLACQSCNRIVASLYFCAILSLCLLLTLCGFSFAVCAVNRCCRRRQSGSGGADAAAATNAAVAAAAAAVVVVAMYVCIRPA